MCQEATDVDTVAMVWDDDAGLDIAQFKSML